MRTFKIIPNDVVELFDILSYMENTNVEYKVHTDIREMAQNLNDSKKLMFILKINDGEHKIETSYDKNIETKEMSVNQFYDILEIFNGQRPYDKFAFKFHIESNEHRRTILDLLFKNDFNEVPDGDSSCGDIYIWKEEKYGGRVVKKYKFINDDYIMCRNDEFRKTNELSFINFFETSDILNIEI